MMNATVYSLGMGGRLEAIKVEGFEMGQAVWYEGWNGSLGWVVGSDNTGYTIITEGLNKHRGQRANSLSPYTRIKPATGHESINAEQIAELEAKHAAKIEADRIESERAAKAHAEQVELIKAELKAKYPNADSRYPSKNLKAELTKAFPGVKFSVTSDYNSIDVRWTDGPTVKQVEEFSSKYQHGNFNGMEDIYEYNHSAHADAMSAVLGSVNYVSEHRSVSENIKNRIADDLRAKGVELDGYNTGIYSYLNVEIYGEYLGLEYINYEWVPQFAGKAPEVKQETPKAAVEKVEGVTIRENTEKNGIEVIFSSRPAESVLTNLKANGFRWSKFQKLWYTRATDQARTFANSLVG